MLWSTIRKEKIQESRPYRDAVAFQGSFDYGNPNAIEHADWVFAQASRRYDLMDSSIREIDDKADSIIRYCSLVVAGAALFIGLTSGSMNAGVFAGIMLGSVLLGLSVIFALGVRSPAEYPHPPSVETIFKQIGKESSLQAAQARCALIYGRAIAALVVLSQIKSRRLRRSYELLAVAIIVFLICLCVQSYLSSFSIHSSSP